MNAITRKQLMRVNVPTAPNPDGIYLDGQETIQNFFNQEKVKYDTDKKDNYAKHGTRTTYKRIQERTRVAYDFIQKLFNPKCRDWETLPTNKINPITQKYFGLKVRWVLYVEKCTPEELKAIRDEEAAGSAR